MLNTRSLTHRAELRNTIYKIVAADCNTVGIPFTQKLRAKKVKRTRKPSRWPRTHRAALTRTCRLLRTEYLPIHGRSTMYRIKKANMKSFVDTFVVQGGVSAENSICTVNIYIDDTLWSDGILRSSRPFVPRSPEKLW